MSAPVLPDRREALAALERQVPSEGLNPVRFLISVGSIVAGVLAFLGSSIVSGKLWDTGWRVDVGGWPPACCWRSAHDPGQVVRNLIL